MHTMARTPPRAQGFQGGLFLFFLALAAGCATIPAPSRRIPSQPLPAQMASYYDYARKPLQANVESTRLGDGFQVQQIQLKAPQEAEFRPITIDWYQPDRPGRHPLVIISPILAGDDLYTREFATFYAARGMHAVIVYRPKEIFSAERQLAEIEDHFRESIIGLRRAIDWLETQEAVDPRRMGSFAISLGSILTTILAAVEPRLKAHVLGLPAGDLPEIIMSSKDKAIRKRRKAYLERHRLSQEEALRELKEVILSEPMRFAPSVDPQRVLIIAGLFDRVLGFKKTLNLWRAMGRPRLILLATGHYSATLATPYLKAATYSFLKRSLKST